MKNIPRKLWLQTIYDIAKFIYISILNWKVQTMLYSTLLWDYKIEITKIDKKQNWKTFDMVFIDEHLTK